MLRRMLRAIVLTLGLTGPVMAQERLLISSDWGSVTAELVDNDATRSLVRMLPITIEMRDHLRQEKIGDLPSPLPAVVRRPLSRRARWGAQRSVALAPPLSHEPRRCEPPVRTGAQSEALAPVSCPGARCSLPVSRPNQPTVAGLIVRFRIASADNSAKIYAAAS